MKKNESQGLSPANLSGFFAYAHQPGLRHLLQDVEKVGSEGRANLSDGSLYIF